MKTNNIQFAVVCGMLWAQGLVVGGLHGFRLFNYLSLLGLIWVTAYHAQKAFSRHVILIAERLPATPEQPAKEAAEALHQGTP